MAEDFFWSGMEHAKAGGDQNDNPHHPDHHGDRFNDWLDGFESWAEEQWIPIAEHDNPPKDAAETWWLVWEPGPKGGAAIQAVWSGAEWLMCGIDGAEALTGVTHYRRMPDGPAEGGEHG